MTILVFYVIAQIPNNEYIICFLAKFHIECRQNHVWGCIFDLIYDHI